MKNIVRCFIVLVACTYANAQVMSKESFFYKEKNIAFHFISSKANSNKFNVMILEESSYSPEEILERTKICTRKNKYIGEIYFILVPKEFAKEKDELVLAFLSDILSKRKLVDKEMHIIADGNYFHIYEEKIAITRRYKGGLLNKIEKLNIIKAGDNWSNFLN